MNTPDFVSLLPRVMAEARRGTHRAQIIADPESFVRAIGGDSVFAGRPTPV